MAEVKIEEIKVILRENLDRDPYEQAIAKAHDIRPKGATLGVKVFSEGKYYGDYVVFFEPTLSASTAVDTINELLKSVLKEVEKNG